MKYINWFYCLRYFSKYLNTKLFSKYFLAETKKAVNDFAL